MKIVDYIQKNRESLPPQLSDVLLQEVSIWTNDACYGYCIAAMESAGYPRDKILAMLHHLKSAFDGMSVEDAEKKWVDF